jgi:ubiquinone/menaquinone biosynthesis C-methylase UbiE
VFAFDLQDGMLQILKNKIEDSILASRIHIHKCKEDSIDFTEKVDFILAFYVIHEVPNQAKLFKEFKSILNPNGAILIVEPKRHVSKTNFEMMINTLKDLEFNILDRPKVFQSRAIYLTSN